MWGLSWALLKIPVWEPLISLHWIYREVHILQIRNEKMWARSTCYKWLYGEWNLMQNMPGLKYKKKRYESASHW